MQTCTGKESWYGGLERGDKALVISTGLQGISGSAHSVLCSSPFFKSLHWDLCFLLTSKIFLIWFSSSFHSFFSLPLFYSQPSLSLSYYLFHHLFMSFFHQEYFLCDKCFPYPFVFFPSAFFRACAIDCTSSLKFLISPSFPSVSSFLLLCSPFLLLFQLHTHAPTSCSIPSLMGLLPWQVPFAHTEVLPLHWAVLAHTSLSCHCLPWTCAGFAYLQFWGWIPK